MSVGIVIKNAVKRYGDNTIIPDLSLEIHPGEFFTLLGPSGCGKTTLLRMIAGFNTIEGGDFYFNQQRVNDLDPSKRNIGMVFQNYAVFPHMSVRENVEYGLKNRRGLSRAEIQERTREYLNMMQIEQFADRLPEKLSGGQQQRVALARALCIQPSVLLMDEPLSNLDAKLRVEMRSAIKAVQHKVGITTIYVTHDQEEAMAVSDRIAVMNEGVILQIGTPKQLYQRPANLFVATFIGRSNLLQGQLAGRGAAGGLLPGFQNSAVLAGVDLLEEAAEGPVIIAVRPEEFQVVRQGAGQLSGTVEECVFLGLNTHYQILLETGERVEVIEESVIGKELQFGEAVQLNVKAEKINVFQRDSGQSLMWRRGEGRRHEKEV